MTKTLEITELRIFIDKILAQTDSKLDRENKIIDILGKKDYNSLDKNEVELLNKINSFILSCEMQVLTIAKRQIDDLKKSQYKLKKSWLEFIDCSIKGRKTNILGVGNKITGDILGEIKWNGGWRQYVFDDGIIILSEGCLYELFSKIKELREEREEKVKKNV